MIAIVTGASGFIGSHLVDQLLARGATVRVLRRPDGSLRRDADPRAEPWVADLLDDRSVRESGIWEGATHLFHLAGVTKRRTLAQFRDGNVVPTGHVLAAAAARGGSTPPRVVLLSSQAAAGPAPSEYHPVREDDPPRPVEAYGRSKVEAEAAVHRYEGRLAATILRPAAVYGPRDRDFLAAFRQAVRPVSVHASPRENRFSLVHVSDVVTAILVAAEHAAAVGRTYFVANDPPVSWQELYDEVARAASAARRLELQLPRAALSLIGAGGDLISAVTGMHSLANRNKMRLARPRWWICDAARIRAELGWTASVPLQAGVRETYLWYLNAGWIHGRAPRTGSASSEEQKA